MLVTGRPVGKMARQVETFPRLARYLEHVVLPMDRESKDDGYLATFIYDQMYLWERDRDGPSPRSEAPEMVPLLELWVKRVQRRIRARARH